MNTSFLAKTAVVTVTLISLSTSTFAGESPQKEFNDFLRTCELPSYPLSDTPKRISGVTFRGNKVFKWQTFEGDAMYSIRVKNSKTFYANNPDIPTESSPKNLSTSSSDIKQWSSTAYNDPSEVIVVCSYYNY